MGPVSNPGHCHMLDVQLTFSSSQPDLHHAAMCWDTYIPETTRGRLPTYTGQPRVGDDTALAVVVI